jgi:hypothetical protein
MDIDYRFSIENVGNREAADPVVVFFKGDYYLFASKSGGYWYSSDFLNWKFVDISDKVLPIERYAPAVMARGDALYFAACDTDKIYTSTNPKAGEWSVVGTCLSGMDPCFMLDDDGRVYQYYGCTTGVKFATFSREHDPKDFHALDKALPCVGANTAQHGWEQRGSDWKSLYQVNIDEGTPWIEGSWMTKHNGIYYLQYAGPGTEWQLYGDGCYTSKYPRGPWTYAPNSPISYKPTGFIGGAGHGCTFQDRDGNYWRTITMTIADKHPFERRLGTFPAGFDKDGLLHTNTVFGDYPQYLPGKHKGQVQDNFVGWMLLSYKKNAEASSSMDKHSTSDAFDENVKTFWCAQTGEPGEWLQVDLGKQCRINAIQSNFAEEGATQMGRDPGLVTQYIIEASTDGKSWSTIVDRSKSTRDLPHDYLELEKPVMARFVKLTNVRFPSKIKFCVRDLRIFGNGCGNPPAAVTDFTVERSDKDQRSATIRWKKLDGVDGYIIRYGIAPDKLYNNYQVYE